MSLHLSDPCILSAYNDIIADGPTDWLLLTYGATRDRLSLLCCGDGGVESLRQSIPPNGDDIFFGFCRERENGRNYNAIIAYVPETVSGVRRARALVHLRAVAGLLKNNHATLHANKRKDLTVENVRDRLKLGPTSIPRAPNSGRIQRSATEPSSETTAGLVQSPPVKKSVSEIRAAPSASPLTPAVKEPKVPALQNLPTPPVSEPAESPRGLESPPPSERAPSQLDNHPQRAVPYSPPPMLPSPTKVGRITSLQGLEIPFWNDFDDSRPPPTPAKDRQSPAVQSFLGNREKSLPTSPVAGTPKMATSTSALATPLAATGFSADSMNLFTTTSAPSSPHETTAPSSFSAFKAMSPQPRSRSSSRSELPYLSEDAGGTDDERPEGQSHSRYRTPGVILPCGRRTSEESSISHPVSRPSSRTQTPAERARIRAEAARQREMEEAKAQQEAAERQARLKWEKEEAIRQVEAEEERRKQLIQEEKRKAAMERQRREMERMLEEDRKAQELAMKRELEREKRQMQARRLEEARLEEKRRAEEHQRRQEERQRVLEQQKLERVKQIQDEFMSRKDPGGPLLAGNITVQSSASIAWRRRYFELTEDSLYFYKSPQERQQPLDILPLVDGHVLAIKEPSDGYDELEAIPHSFVLEIDEDGPWSFYADSAEAKLILTSLLTQVAEL